MMKKYMFCLVLLLVVASVSAQEEPHIAITEELVTPSGSGGVDVSFSNGADVVGFQFTISWQPDELSFDSIGGINLLGLTPNEFGLTDVDNGQLSVLWFDNTLSGTAIGDTEQVLFRIHFSALPDAVDTNAISFATTLTPPLVVTLDATGNVAEFAPGLTNGALVSPPPLIIGEALLTNASCFSSTDASATIIATGGYPPYTYLLEDESSVEGVFLNKSAGDYQITVVDSQGGMTSTMITLTEPEALAINTLMITPACEGENNGTVDLQVDGGTAPYSYLWSNNSTELDLVDIGSGVYELFVTDANNCLQSTLVTVENVVLIDTLTYQQPSCFGFADGSAQVVLLDADYSTIWSDGQTGTNVMDLTAGNYSVIINNGNGCSQTVPFNLEDGPEIDPNVSINYGCGDGNITVIINPLDGQSPFDVEWSTGSTGLAIANVVAGQYDVLITDATGCVGSQNFTVDYIPPLIVVDDVEDVSCTGAMDGSISLSVSGGIPPYSYLWNTGETTENLTELEGGLYFVNITTSSCAITENIVVEESLPINIDVYFTEAAEGFLNAQAIVSGGVSPYIINWSTGEQGGSIENIPLDTAIEIMVEDANGCEQSIMITANLTDTNIFDPYSAIEVYPNPSNGFLRVDLPVVTDKDIQLRVYQINGRLVMDHRIQNLYSNPNLDLTRLPAGLYLLELYADYEVLLKKRIVLLE